MQFASPSASISHPGHHSLIGSISSRTSVSSSTSSSSSGSSRSSSSSSLLANPASSSMNHSSLLPSALHPGIPGHATSNPFSQLASAEANLNSQHAAHPHPPPPPPPSSHNPAYLPSHHAMAAAASIHSAAAAAVAHSTAAAAAVSSGSLIRPHLPTLGQTHPFPSSAVVPLGAAPYLNRPVKCGSLNWKER